MGWTQADLDAIDTAIKAGVRVVEFQDRRVEYRRLDDLLAVKDMIEKELGITPAPPSRCIPVSFVVR